MTTRQRIALLFALLMIAGLAGAHAWPGGTCQVACMGEPVFLQSVSSQEECCWQQFTCPDGSSPWYMVYEPDEGWPFFCGPFASLAAPEEGPKSVDRSE